jgi:hypothetical protein
MEIMETFILSVLGGAIYLLPSLIASAKKRKNSGAILLLNLLLGWTVIGWIVALIWAATE